MASAKVTFTHPLAPDPLNVYVNPDQVTWAYGLNTKSYPTYGGEVVQILSVYFDDITIAGTVRSYAELEAIYSWFLAYMQKATAGINIPVYNQQPVRFTYHERNWEFDIWPHSLPGFRYGRDVVAPTWTLQAAVKEPETDFSGTQITKLSDAILSQANFNASYKGQLSTFGVATADFGSIADLENNPFASSSAPAAVKGNVDQYLTQEEKSLGDTFNSFVQDWNNQNLSALPQFKDASGPANVTGNGSKTSQKSGSVKKK